MMNRKYLFLAVAILAGLLCVSAADAGWFDKDDDAEKESNAHRYDFLPSMSYHMGVLRRDTYSGWSLDNVTIQFMPGTTVMVDGQGPGNLREGSKAIVMGPKVGETIVAWRVRGMGSDWNVTRDNSYDTDISWSDSDRTVGEGSPGPQ